MPPHSSRRRLNRRIPFGWRLRYVGPTLEIIMASVATIEHPARAVAQHGLLIPSGNVGPLILDLAARHDVSYVETDSDREADDYTRLSDAGEPVLDGVELALLALSRANVINVEQRLDLHAAYIRNDLGLE
jgi:hypothetical protein